MPKIPSCWHQIYHHDIIIFSSVCSCSMPPSSLYIFIPPALNFATTAAPDLLAGIRICLLSSIKANAMESSDTTTPFSYSPASSPTSSSPPPQPPAAIHSPCAACKILRRRCADKCVLAPYFPPTEPLKFTTAHRVFGASNIIKLLQDLPESQRADAVSSMVYEANARIRDPVYGCAGAICQLQKQVNELQAQLARSQAELINLQAQNKNLLTLICMEMAQMQRSDCSLHQDQGAEHGLFFQNDAYFLDDIAQGCLFDESLWI